MVLQDENEEGDYRIEAEFQPFGGFKTVKHRFKTRFKTRIQAEKLAKKELVLRRLKKQTIIPTYFFGLKKVKVVRVRV